MTRFLLVGLAWLAASAAQAQAPSPGAGNCFMVIRDRGQSLQIPLTGFDPSVTSTPLPDANPDAGASMVLCNRATVMPELTDYRVPFEMGQALAIRAGRTIVVLSIDKDHLTITTPDNEPADEKARIQARVDEMQAIMMSRVSAAK